MSTTDPRAAYARALRELHHHQRMLAGWLPAEARRAHRLALIRAVWARCDAERMMAEEEKEQHERV